MPTTPRIFPHFPEDCVCPLCGTNADKDCCLIPISCICEAQPTHIDCLRDISTLRYSENRDILYRII